MRVINLRQATRAVTGAGPGAEGNVTKLLSAEHAQRVSELALRLCGTAAVTGDEPEIAVEYLFDRCLTIMRRHLGDHPQRHRRTHTRPAPRPTGALTGQERDTAGPSPVTGDGPAV